MFIALSTIIRSMLAKKAAGFSLLFNAWCEGIVRALDAVAAAGGALAPA